MSIVVRRAVLVLGSGGGACSLCAFVVCYHHRRHPQLSQDVVAVSPPTPPYSRYLLVHSPLSSCCNDRLIPYLSYLILRTLVRRQAGSLHSFPLVLPSCSLFHVSAAPRLVPPPLCSAIRILLLVHPRVDPVPLSPSWYRYCADMSPQIVFYLCNIVVLLRTPIGRCPALRGDVVNFRIPLRCPSVSLLVSPPCVQSM